MSKVSSTSEDYLETIYVLAKENNAVRNIDIANALGVTRASVNKAMNVLKDLGYIEQEYYGNITLTKSGIKLATEVYERHILLMDFLINVLGVNKEIAETDACKMEHLLSKETLFQIKTFMDNR